MKINCLKKSIICHIFNPHKKRIIVFIAANLLIVFTTLFLCIKTNKNGKRGLASISGIEIEYAEKFLIDEEPEKLDPELVIAAPYTDDLERRAEVDNSFEGKLNQAILRGYERKLLKKTYQVTGKKPEKPNLKDLVDEQMKRTLNTMSDREKERFVQKFLQNARNDGVEIILDEDLNIVSVKSIKK